MEQIKTMERNGYFFIEEKNGKFIFDRPYNRRGKDLSKFFELTIDELNSFVERFTNEETKEKDFVELRSGLVREFKKREKKIYLKIPTKIDCWTNKPVWDIETPEYQKFKNYKAPELPERDDTDELRIQKLRKWEEFLGAKY